MQKSQEQSKHMEVEGDILIFDKGGVRNGTIKEERHCMR